MNKGPSEETIRTFIDLVSLVRPRGYATNLQYKGWRECNILVKVLTPAPYP